MSSAAQTAEQAARSSYGRLLAYLASRTRDLAEAEDALADAFAKAVERWPRDGVPERPDAWLLQAAKRRLVDRSRRRSVRTAAAGELRIVAEEAEAASTGEAPLPDDRLKLLFVCAHPAITPELRTPLMLQTVLGLDAVAIGSAFLVRPKTMGQRLVRVKTKIRDARIRFEVPEPGALSERLVAVLDAIYAAFGTGWEGVGADPRHGGLTSEAIYLARLLTELLPEEPEAKGLLALMLYCESRRRARRDERGGYVPLRDQNATHWDGRMLEEAEAQLRAAGALGRAGPFQLEAAIQSAHCQRAFGGQTWRGRVELSAFRC